MLKPTLCPEDEVPQYREKYHRLSLRISHELFAELQSFATPFRRSIQSVMLEALTLFLEAEGVTPHSETRPVSQTRHATRKAFAALRAAKG